ncbi:uncharacterized protein LOC113306337 [Papaver somniferum]|uniref:uncharacterized protein LOC113306337 n=1 Tax=Papaver somniferum TaxID=3469 RepID=UPI000E702089|nr:uncharacterized protein LOC113306337 [Papaver somniferum]
MGRDGRTSKPSWNTGTAIPAGIRVGADEVVVAVKGDDSLHKSCCPVKIDPGLLDVKHFTYVEQDKPMVTHVTSKKNSRMKEVLRDCYFSDLGFLRTTTDVKHDYAQLQTTIPN